MTHDHDEKWLLGDGPHLGGPIKDSLGCLVPAQRGERDSKQLITKTVFSVFHLLISGQCAISETTTTRTLKEKKEHILIFILRPNI